MSSRPDDDRFRGSECELVTGTLRVFRTWRAAPRGLSALALRTPWNPDGSLTARCEGRRGCDCDECLETWRRRHPIHDRKDAPYAPCMCGIYGWYDVNRLILTPSPIRTYVRVHGSMRVWGRVVMGTKGVRAQHAQIEALVVAEDDHERFRVLYPELHAPLVADLGELARSYPQENVRELIGS